MSAYALNARADRLGRLSYALGAGKAIVSTAYRYAEGCSPTDAAGWCLPRQRGDRRGSHRSPVERHGAPGDAQAIHLCPQHGVERCRRAVSRDLSRGAPRTRRQTAHPSGAHPAIDRPGAVGASLDHLGSSPTRPAFFSTPVSTFPTAITATAPTTMPALIVALLGQHVLPNADRSTGWRTAISSCSMRSIRAGRFPTSGLRPALAGCHRQRGCPGRALWALGRTVLDSPSPGMTGAAMTLFEQSPPPVEWQAALLVFSLGSARSPSRVWAR